MTVVQRGRCSMRKRVHVAVVDLSHYLLGPRSYRRLHKFKLLWLLVKISQGTMNKFHVGDGYELIQVIGTSLCKDLTGSSE